MPAATMAAMASPGYRREQGLQTRHAILRAVQEAEGNLPTVRKLSGVVGVSNQVIYQHLMVLIDVGFVEVRSRRGLEDTRISITQRGVAAVAHQPGRNGSKE